MDDSCYWSHMLDHGEHTKNDEKKKPSSYAWLYVLMDSPLGSFVLWVSL